MFSSFVFSGTHWTDDRFQVRNKNGNLPHNAGLVSREVGTKNGINTSSFNTTKRVSGRDNFQRVRRAKKTDQNLLENCNKKLSKKSKKKKEKKNRTLVKKYFQNHFMQINLHNHKNYKIQTLQCTAEKVFLAKQKTNVSGSIRISTSYYIRWGVHPDGISWKQRITGLYWWTRYCKRIWWIEK